MANNNAGQEKEKKKKEKKKRETQTTCSGNIEEGVMNTGSQCIY